jgi:PAS domain S-box-containing protein
MDMPDQSLDDENMSDVRSENSCSVISSRSSHGGSEEGNNFSPKEDIECFERKNVGNAEEIEHGATNAEEAIPTGAPASPAALVSPAAPSSPVATSVNKAASMISDLHVRSRSNSLELESNNDVEIDRLSACDSIEMSPRRCSIDGASIDGASINFAPENKMATLLQSNDDDEGLAYESQYDEENPYDALDDPEVIVTAAPRSKTVRLVQERNREKVSFKYRFTLYKKLAAEIDAMKEFVSSRFDVSNDEISNKLESDPNGDAIKAILDAFKFANSHASRPIAYGLGDSSTTSSSSSSDTLSSSSGTHSSSSADITLSDSSTSLSERLQSAKIESSSESHRSDSSSGSGNLISNLSSLGSSSSSSSGDVCDAPFAFAAAAQKAAKKKLRIQREPTGNTDQVFEQRVRNQFMDIFMNDKDASSFESVQSFSSEMRNANSDSRNLKQPSPPESDHTTLASPIFKTLTALTHVVGPKVTSTAASSTSTGSTDTSGTSSTPSTLTAPIASSITPSIPSVISVSEFDRKLMGTLDQASQTFLLTDPNIPGNPIIFASGAFFAMVGYSPEEVLGRNCRFLQGPETDPIAIDMISRGLRSMKDVHVCILNYRKDGSKFYNRLVIAPLRKSNGELSRFIGVQCPIEPAIGLFLTQAQQKTYKFMFGNIPECEKIIQESKRRGVYSENFDTEDNC